MASFDGLAPAASAAIDTDPLGLAVVAHLARYKGTTRMHTESDLRIYLDWCVRRGLEPLAVGRHQVELYVRWLHRARNNLDRHPNYILAAYMASGT